jgi:hypothetical protein
MRPQAQWDQLVSQSNSTKRATRLTPKQKKAVRDYEFALKQEDRYLGSVFVTSAGQANQEAKTRAAYLKAEALEVGYLC